MKSTKMTCTLLLFVSCCLISLNLIGQSSVLRSRSFIFGTGVSDAVGYHTNGIGVRIRPNYLPAFSYTLGILSVKNNRKKCQPLVGIVIRLYGLRSKNEYPDRLNIGDSIVKQINRQTLHYSFFHLGIPIGININLPKSKPRKFFRPERTETEITAFPIH